MLRLDRTLNFDWGTGSPDSRVPVDNFAVRWSGKIKPSTSASYTFYTDTAGGVRLWVNGQLLVDNWTLHSLTTNTAKITLSAGTSYDIRVEYQHGTDCIGEVVVEQLELRQDDRAAKRATRSLTTLTTLTTLADDGGLAYRLK